MVFSRYAKYQEKLPGNDERKNKYYTRKEGMGINFYSSEKNIFENKKNKHSDTRQ